jgi:hypothetical protein
MQTLNHSLNNINTIQLVTDETLLSTPCEAAEASANHLKTLYNNSHLGNFSLYFRMLSLATTSNLDDCKSLKCLQLPKSIGLEIPAFLQTILYLFLNLFLILAYLSNNFLLYGSKQQLFLFFMICINSKYFFQST